MRFSRRLRNRIIGLTRRARETVAEIGPERPHLVELKNVQRRLELLLKAMFGQQIEGSILTSGTPNDDAVVLPRSVTGDGAAEHYRLLAIEQGARLARGSRALTPNDPLERDLYQIIEAASIDAGLVELAPGLAIAIARERRAELRRRSSMVRLPNGTGAVESLLKQLLSSDPSAPPPSVPLTASPEESVIAARRMAAEMRRARKAPASYPGIEWVRVWDHKNAGRIRDEIALMQSDTFLQSTDEATHRAEAPQPDATRDDSNDSRDPGNTDGDAGAPVADDEVSFQKHDDPAVPTAPAPGGIQYPEWVNRFKRMEPRYASVFDVEAAQGDGAWARDALTENAGVVRDLRARFSLLRARRLRLKAQRTGEEIDLDAVVSAMVDMHLQRVPSDRLYQTTRSSRQPLAITILVDNSGSTREQLPDGQTVLDVERLSVVLASEALASLGDPYSILAFSGNSRHRVRVTTLKAFDERGLGPMHARISALAPGDNTRLGAAVRHATARLLKQSAHRHVLLILSDGKPNDVDWYWADAAIEDSRIALLEARAAGVHSFCITVDTKEADYLPHLFGEGRYWVLDNPAELPKALIRLIDTILTA